MATWTALHSRWISACPQKISSIFHPHPFFTPLYNTQMGRALSFISKVLKSGKPTGQRKFFCLSKRLLVSFSFSQDFIKSSEP